MKVNGKYYLQLPLINLRGLAERTAMTPTTKTIEAYTIRFHEPI